MTFDFTKMTPTELRTSVNVPQKRVRGNAVARLSKAIARQVRDNSDDLARRLFLRALDGDVNCSKLLLVTLIEKIPQADLFRVTWLGSNPALQLFRKINARHTEPDKQVIARQNRRTVRWNHELLHLRRLAYASHAAFDHSIERNE